MDLIQLSDLHFGNNGAPFDERKLAQTLSEYINKNTNEIVLLLSGDITFQGKDAGYNIAHDFIEEILKTTQLERNDILICPGNHDIVNNGFEAFDNFSYRIRRDNNLLFSNKNHHHIKKGNVLFTITNSSFHLNHKYGYINDSLFYEVEKVDGEIKILILHHHIINQFENDTSAVRNSYDLVRFVDDNNYNLVLHGHQHSEQRYHFGKNATPVISARSGNLNQTGYLNAMNHFKFDQNKFTAESLVFENSSNKIILNRLKEV